MNKKLEDFVNVSLRIKPCNNELSSCLQIINNEPPVLLVHDKSQLYHFDNIFDEKIKQKDVYFETVKPLVENVKNGYNSTVFAYGQTGTGKTYTMGTNPNIKRDEDVGLISRTLEDFFHPLSEDEEMELFISFIEIYNEKVFDLLATNNKIPLPVKGFTVHGFEKMRICNSNEALFFLNSGGKNRHTSETKQNFNSSRSHAIFTIYCCIRNREKETFAKMNLVDLAGSESVRKTGNQGNSFHEGININKGLLSLGQVMTALSSNSSHIPYRQSVITTILQDSLNKKNYVSLIACVSPNPEDIGETLQTLEFSQRVKKLRNKPEINQFILHYKRENPLFSNYKGLTPSKRSTDQMYDTPFKKPRSFLPVIQEPTSIVNSSNSESSKFMTSFSAENLQPNFSPVIRKYMNALENTLVNKLEDVIKSTLKRPSRNSLKEHKENIVTPRTPTFPWDKVARVVRAEILQFTGQSSRAASSPIEDCKLTDISTSSIESNGGLHPRNLLVNENSNSKLSLSFEDLKNKNKDDVQFKVPQPILKIKSVKAKVSPIKRRSSIRLQKKAEAQNTTERRRSVRLLMKINEVNKTQNITDGELQPILKKRKPSQKLNRLDNSCCNCEKTKTVSARSKKSKASPVTRRTRKILNILNNGSLQEIATLHTVGTKTAEKIKFFRELKGTFNSVSDLKEMPYWTTNRYQKFLTENFLQEK